MAMRCQVLRTSWVGPLVGLALGMAGAQAADDGRAQVEQRVRLTARLISDAPTAQRIAESGNAGAIGHLDEGRLHQARAEDALRRGDLDAARKAVDQALHHVTQARRLAPDAPARQAAARARYEQMLAALDRLVETWRARSVATGTSDTALLDAVSRLGGARTLAQQGRYEDAHRALSDAERTVLDGMSRLLGSREIDYTARAATPAEEFQIELARYQGLADLIPIALRELGPTPAAMNLVERYRENGDELRAQAMLAFHNGDVNGAIEGLRRALQSAQRALAAAGVATPQPSGS